MAEFQPVEQDKVLAFVKDYLLVIDENIIEISHKRNTLKSRVKQLSLQYKIPKDFANYISLFLMVTKFIYVENKIWKVNYSLKDKLDKPEFLIKNMFKFLFFSRDYNEYYKSPLVFNTIFANNDYEIIRKRKSIIKTLSEIDKEERISFEKLYQVLSKRYAFFREYNNPSNFYYTKAEVFSNKQLIFIFLFKTLNFLGVTQLEKKGKTMVDYYFKITDSGYDLINDYMAKFQEKNRSVDSEKQIIKPYEIYVKPEFDTHRQNILLNRVLPKQMEAFSIQSFSPIKESNSSGNQDFLVDVRNQLVRRAQESNTPNLLV